MQKRSFIPESYQSKLNLYETQTAIGFIKNTFQEALSQYLNLKRVSAPLFVLQETGINDGLNGEEPVSFMVKNLNKKAEVVHSLAKWKRMALYRYDFHVGNGLYTDMNAIRKEEELDNLHSLYVDQWDWEKVIDKKDRTIDYLKDTVRSIVKAIHHTSILLKRKYPALEFIAPDDVFFIDSQALEDMFPNLTPKQRENEIVKQHPCIFIKRIGYPLLSGMPHDLRAPDYDDWLLNGDLLYYHKTLDMAVEISSMGIRVDHNSLVRQLTILNKLDDLKYPYHSMIKDEILPYTIGGGIGQSRLCLLLLEKAHIGEVQSSIWDQETIELCKDKAILI
ncbi:aspartate--ammonia ligase [Acholeplasma equirhinis]|uniref:aspartate--ammonia ligase n=1 Tax=Acholeplasma equirhinis TaxID=555393 RepID=UPI00197AE8D0|nr:aspartate--ammonia ligase [Acholeplasma equirhinis]MBN3491137.1 aspartate--ammonia ligase [Acholeplasma equirhinis]